MINHFTKSTLSWHTSVVVGCCPNNDTIFTTNHLLKTKNYCNIRFDILLYCPSQGFYSWKVVFSDGIWDFSLTRLKSKLILFFSIGFVFFLIGHSTIRVDQIK